MRTEDIAEQLRFPPGRQDGAPLGERYAWREEHRRQSSARACAEHTIGEEKKWRPLQRYLGRRESYAETHAVVDGPVCDRAARRPARRSTSTELVLARQTAY